MCEMSFFFVLLKVVWGLLCVTGFRSARPALPCFLAPSLSVCPLSADGLVALFQRHY